jgi:hypothetical protein
VSTAVRVLGLLFGLNLVVTGSVRAVLLCFVPGYPRLYRVLGIAVGVLSVHAGILCLRHRTASFVLLLLLVFLSWLAHRLVEAFLAAEAPDPRP